MAWVGRQPFSSFFCASPAPAGLRGFAEFCTLCPGVPVGLVSALWTPVSSPCWLSLTSGWVCFWAAVSMVSVGCEVCGLGCPSWLVLTFLSLFVLLLLLGWGVWSQVCDPTCSSWILGSYGVSVAPFCHLSLWPHPPYFLAEDFFLGHLLGLGVVGCVLPRFLPSYGGTLLPLSWFLLGGSYRLVVQAPDIFLESFLGFFPLASSVCC